MSAPLSVDQVRALRVGEKDHPAWIDDGFFGIVAEVTEKKTKTGKLFYPCRIADNNTSQTVEVSLFVRPPFNIGDTVEFTGKGMRRTEYQGAPKVDISKDTSIRVVSSPPPRRDERRNDAPHNPANDSRGTGGSQGNLPMDTSRGGPTERAFHKAMKRQALLWCHCWRYSTQVEQRLKVTLTPEQRQGFISTMFIEANRSGVGGHPPALEPAAPHNPAPDTGGRNDPPHNSRPLPGPGGSAFPNEDLDEDLDEDVPF